MADQPGVAGQLQSCAACGRSSHGAHRRGCSGRCACQGRPAGSPGCACRGGAAPGGGGMR